MPGWWRPVPRRRHTPPPPPPRPRPRHDLAAELARVTAERDRLRDELDRAAGPPFPAWVNTGGCPCHHCTPQDTP